MSNQEFSGDDLRELKSIIRESEKIEAVVKRQGFLADYDLSKEQRERWRHENGAMTVPSDKQYYISADSILTQWGRIHKSTHKSAIERITGALRKTGTPQSEIILEDKAFDHVAKIINKMMLVNREFLHLHYVDRNTRITISAYAKKQGIKKWTYDRNLRASKYEFIIRGGIQ